MNAKLSWKILVPIGIICWIAGGQMSDVIVGGFLAVLGLISFALGVVDLIQSRRKKPAATQQNETK